MQAGVVLELREHGGVQAGVVLELRVLQLVGNRKSTEKLGSILRIGNLKSQLHSDTFSPTRPYPL